MARPRSFDQQIVLDQVMSLFWAKGYGATSMMDIQKTTGLKPGSLYDSFGDKHQLFIDAIKHYRQTIVRKRLDKLTKPGPARARLDAFFADLIDFSLGEGKKLGCLMSNTAVEMAPHDATSKELVQDNMAEITKAFGIVVSDGIANGEFKTTEPVEDIACFLVSTLQGLRVMAKTSATKETLESTVRMALKILD